MLAESVLRQSNPCHLLNILVDDSVAGYEQFGSIVYDVDLYNIRTVYPDVEATTLQDKATFPQAIYGLNVFIEQQLRAKVSNHACHFCCGPWIHIRHASSNCHVLLLLSANIHA